MSAAAARALLAIELEPRHPSEELEDDVLLERARRQVEDLRRAARATQIHSLTAYAVITDGGLSLGEIADQTRARLEIWEVALACPDTRPPLLAELWMLARPTPGMQWRDLQGDARDALYAWWGRSTDILGALVRTAQMAPDLSAPSMRPVQLAALEHLGTLTLTEAEAAACRRWGVQR